MEQMTALTCVGLSPKRVDWHLWNWERWHQHWTRPGKLPRRASGRAEGFTHTGNVNDEEAMYEENDRGSAVAVQAIVGELSERHRISVYVEHGIMSAVYRLRDADAAYGEACDILSVQLAKRGFC